MTVYHCFFSNPSQSRINIQTAPSMKEKKVWPLKLYKGYMMGKKIWTTHLGESPKHAKNTY